MGDGLRLSKQEEQRAVVLGQGVAGLLGIGDAGTLIGVGERQVRWLLADYEQEGPRGLVHGNRGRPPAHATSGEVRARVIALANGKYEGVNHSHLAELLGEWEGPHVSRPCIEGARPLRR